MYTYYRYVGIAFGLLILRITPLTENTWANVM